MSEKCNFPECNRQAQASWALVPLCRAHRETIEQETRRYYRKSITYEERRHYNRIASLIPWSQARKEAFR